MTLGIVISYSSNEALFLAVQLREAIRCADQVVYAVGSHKYDMSPEITPSDLRLQLQHAVAPSASLPASVSVVSYEVQDDVKSTPRKYHNRARAVGVAALDPSIEWVLLLDADEIPDGRRMREWFTEHRARLMPTLSYKLACHWYFIKPTWQAQQLEDSIVLVHRTYLTPEALTDARERDGIVARTPGGCMRRLQHADGKPLFHHFSWVRTWDQMCHKVQTWGHRGDRDWLPLLKLIWDRQEPPTRDFVHGYSYTVVPDQFGIGFLITDSTLNEVD